MRKTIAGLEDEIARLRAERDYAMEELRKKEEIIKHGTKWAVRHTELTDRLLNILEWRAKEGNV